MSRTHTQSRRETTASLGRQLGVIFKAGRTRRGLSQRALAELLELAPSYVCKLERGHHVPNLFLLARLVHELAIDGAELLAVLAAAGCPAAPAIEPPVPVALEVEHKAWLASYCERQQPIGGITRKTCLIAFRAKFPATGLEDSTIAAYLRELDAYEPRRAPTVLPGLASEPTKRCAPKSRRHLIAQSAARMRAKKYA